MKWFRHDASAHTDAKLARLRHKYGITGYGLYWYCLELIAERVDRNNVTFQLEHDAELVALEWRIDRVTVSEIMRYMVEIKLFEDSGGRITCLKMARRLDDTTSKNPEIRKMLAKMDLESDDNYPTNAGHYSENAGDIPTNAGDSSDRLDKIRLDEKELLTLEPQAGSNANSVKMTRKDHDMVISIYHDTLPELTAVLTNRWYGSVHAKALQARWKESEQHRTTEFWQAFFDTVRINDWWMGRRNGSDGEPWRGCKLSWLVKRSNFDKVLEAGS